MGFPAARLTDLHVCPMVIGIVPHVGGPVTAPGMPTVLIQGLPAARVGDILTCVGPPDVIVKGSSGVFIGKQPAARMLDNCAHGGLIVMGCFTVLIGETSAGGGGGGGGTTPQAQALADIALGKSNVIKIEGSDAFKTQTLVALAQILSTPSGQEWFAQMQKNGRSVTIHQGAPGQNDCTPRNGTNAANGTGSDSDINWDPATTSLGGFNSDVANCGNDTILFHEMVHGMHNGNGDHRNGPTDSFSGQSGGSQRGEERSTVGAPANVLQPDGTTRPIQQPGPPVSNAPAGQQVNYDGTKPGENYPTENSYRRDKGIPERPSYYPTNWPGGAPW